MLPGRFHSYVRSVARQPQPFFYQPVAGGILFRRCQSHLLPANNPSIPAGSTGTAFRVSELRGGYYRSASNIYGAELFRNVPASFAPSNLNPASADDVIGPDDELRIHIRGGINYTGNLRVDRSGNIFLPQFGAVHVAGLKFAELDGPSAPPRDGSSGASISLPTLAAFVPFRSM
jgi:hypothetical protein